MLVNAANHPGPALWQGLMLIVLAVWAVWLISGERSLKQAKTSVGVVVVIGVALIISIVKFF